MANRNFSSNGLSLERKSVSLWARINIGASGAPTLQKRNTDGTFSAAGTAGWGGIKSISRTSQGLYVLTLQDNYVSMLAFWGGFIKDTASTIANVTPKATGSDVTSKTAPQITFCTYSSAPAVADPANGEIMFLEIELADSSAV